MKCSQCSSSDSKVVESRDVADGKAIRRRRECITCGHRFTTYERIERPQLIVVKNDGTRELFDREKLLAGLYRACQKTPVTSVELEQLVTRIEDKLYGCGETDISTHAIGQYAMDELAALNEVAYVRFASVYRRFKDIAGFERELSVVKHYRTLDDSRGADAKLAAAESVNS
jgi:transcriptional repressor NrdR